MSKAVIDWVGNKENHSKNYQGMEKAVFVENAVKKAVIIKPMIENYLRYAELIMGEKIYGAVADLGSGRGIVAAVLANCLAVKQVYAVEYSRNHVVNIMPRVFSEISERPEKILRVVGDFNDLKFEDNTLDFVVELGAFHHSEKVQKTFCEAYRVLKPGGWFIGIERSQPDGFTDEQIKRLLDIEYGNVWKKIWFQS